MPTGLPDLSNLTLYAKSSLDEALRLIHNASIYLHIPSYDDYTDSIRVAFIDSIRSIRSLYKVLFLTFRPILILLALLGRYLAILLRILAECTVKHGIVAAREGYGQARTATIWFVSWQRSLSQGAVLAEVGIIVALVGLYALRRFIRRKRYVERVRRWVGIKKRRALRRYNNLVDKVSQTSMFLAMLLPHALCLFAWSLCRYLAPWLPRYFATKTYSTLLISLWVPFVRTVLLMHRWKEAVRREKEEEKKKKEEERREASVTAAVAVVDASNGSGGVGVGSQRFGGWIARRDNAAATDADADNDDTVGPKRKSSSKVAERYLKATEQRSFASSESALLGRREESNTDGRENDNGGNDGDRGGVVVDDDDKVYWTTHRLNEEATELLRYWVVYALIASIGRIACMLPIIGRIVSVVASDPSKNASVASGSGASNGAAMRWRRWRLGSGGIVGGRGRKASSFWSSVTLSYESVEEAKLVFFLWLRYLPTSLTGSDGGAGAGTGSVSPSGNVVSRSTAAWEERTKSPPNGADRPSASASSAYASSASDSNRPLNMLYDELVPLAVAAADSSSNLSRATDSDTGIKGAMHRGMKLVRSFLQVAVFMKVLSEPTKNRIDTALVDCSALLPAAVTLLMPGYFTEFGCIYVSSIVPSANSAGALAAAAKKDPNDDATRTDHAGDDDVALIMRYLKFWIVHCLLSSLISSFAPILAWVPLSTHATWLLWAYAQLESPTNRIYSALEWELKAFGLLHRHGDDDDDDDNGEEEIGFDQTMIATVFRMVASALPSASSSELAVGEGEAVVAKSENATTGGGSGDATSEEGEMLAGTDSGEMTADTNSEEMTAGTDSEETTAGTDSEVMKSGESDSSRDVVSEPAGLGSTVAMAYAEGVSDGLRRRLTPRRKSSDRQNDGEEVDSGLLLDTQEGLTLATDPWNGEKNKLE